VVTIKSDIRVSVNYLFLSMAYRFILPLIGQNV